MTIKENLMWMPPRRLVIKYLKEDIENVINELEELRYDLGWLGASDNTAYDAVGISSSKMRDISNALGKVSALINSL